MLTPRRQLGNKGEDVACEFLISSGFSIVGRNIGNKFGEIDIIAKKGKVLHFIEVKSGVASDKINPIENLNYHKIRKFRRIVEIYLANNRVSAEQRWQMDAIVVVFSGGSPSYDDCSALCVRGLPPVITYLENINIR